MSRTHTLFRQHRPVRPIVALPITSRRLSRLSAITAARASRLSREIAPRSLPDTCYQEPLPRDARETRLKAPRRGAACVIVAPYSVVRERLAAAVESSPRTPRRNVFSVAVCRRSEEDEGGPSFIGVVSRRRNSSRRSDFSRDGAIGPCFSATRRVRKTKGARRYRLHPLDEKNTVFVCAVVDISPSQSRPHCRVGRQQITVSRQAGQAAGIGTALASRASRGSRAKRGSWCVAEAASRISPSRDLTLDEERRRNTSTCQSSLD